MNKDESQLQWRAYICKKEILSCVILFIEKTKAIHSGCAPFQLSQIVLTEGQTPTGLHISYYYT